VGELERCFRFLIVCLQQHVDKRRLSDENKFNKRFTDQTAERLVQSIGLRKR